MERQPVKTIPIHEHLRPRLCDTYENDSIFDKFEVVFSGDAKNVMTGSYNNNFMIYPSEEGKDTEVVLQADKSAFKAKKVGIPTPMVGKDGKKGNSRANSPAPPGGAQRMRKETDADQIDFNKKILHMSWHPREDSIAIAATNNVSSPRAMETRTCWLTIDCSFLSSRHCRVRLIGIDGIEPRSFVRTTALTCHVLVGTSLTLTHGGWSRLVWDGGAVLALSDHE